VGRQQPVYRVIIEMYGETRECSLGFVPSHHEMSGSVAATTAVAPTPLYDIHNYGGWSIEARASRLLGTKYSGWTVVPPAASAYATTAAVPAVPAGGAVEFAVDYVTGTCCVAFYTPVAVAGGFVDGCN
jgi:hypothetical protein